MPVKIRLQRKGRRKRPFYHIVIADSRAPRDGRFIERIGSYNPMTKPATIELDNEKALEWMEKGAQPTDTTRAILKFKGVLYKKHLLRGVKKGSFSLEKANEMFENFMKDKDAKVAARFEATAAEKEAHRVAMFGVAKQVEEAPVELEEAAEAVAEEAGDVAEAAVETAEEAVEQVENAVEEVVEEAKDAAEEATGEDA